MNNLSERIRTHIDVLASPLTLDEVADGDAPPIPLAADAARSRPARTATLVIAAAAVIAIGVVSLASRSTGSEPHAVSPPPLPAGLRATGVMYSPEDALTLTVANDVSVAECMTKKGFNYPMPTSDELIAMSGEWHPHPVLGIGSAGAARRIGYHLAGTNGLGSPSQLNAVQLMEADQRDAFLTALGGPPTSSPGDAAVNGGCSGEVRGPTVDNDERLRAAVNAAAGIGQGAMSGTGFDDQALADTRVKDALRSWSECVETATGEKAGTPNELARRYLDRSGYDGSASPKEIKVATADAQCQERTQLWTVWYTAVAELTRQRLGDKAGMYDQWTRARTKDVEDARAAIAAHGVELPSLN